MDEHLIAKLVAAMSGVIGVVVATIPDAVTPWSTEQVEAWARFGVAGGCLLVMVIGILYTVPKMAKDHREALNAAHAAHERTINRICESHAGSMREMRAEQREDGTAFGKQLEALTGSIERMRDAAHEEGRMQRDLLAQQLTQLTQIREIKSK